MSQVPPTSQTSLPVLSSAPGATVGPGEVRAIAVPKPTPAQAISAALQNGLIVLVIAAAWYLGKIDAATALPTLLGVAGIDLISRKSAQQHIGTALAVGTTTALNLFSKGIHL